MKIYLRLAVILLLVGSGVLGFWFSLSRESVSSFQHVRTTFHSPSTFVRQLEGDPEAGSKIFHMFCASCHASAPLIDVEAPPIGDEKRWSLWSKVGRLTLLQLTLQGKGAMPARGGCFECSDAQLMEAIDYILKNSLQKKT